MENWEEMTISLLRKMSCLIFPFFLPSSEKRGRTVCQRLRIPHISKGQAVVGRQDEATFPILIALNELFLNDILLFFFFTLFILFLRITILLLLNYIWNFHFSFVLSFSFLKHCVCAFPYLLQSTAIHPSQSLDYKFQFGCYLPRVNDKTRTNWWALNDWLPLGGWQTCVGRGRQNKCE